MGPTRGMAGGAGGTEGTRVSGGRHGTHRGRRRRRRPRGRNPERLALVLGTEGAGMSEETLAAVDLAVKIPMRAGVDSLNVAPRPPSLSGAAAPRLTLPGPAVDPPTPRFVGPRIWAIMGSWPCCAFRCRAAIPLIPGSWQNPVARTKVQLCSLISTRSTKLLFSTTWLPASSS